MEEKKGLITGILGELLKLTRQCEDLSRLEYRPGPVEEVVIATFANGVEKVINVTADSGIALIKDVVKGLE